MNNSNLKKSPENDESLGFDPGSILLSLRLKLKLIVTVVVLSAFLGITCGFIFGRKVFQSESILRYRLVGEEPTMGETNFIFTQLSMVKLATNLEEVRKKLNLAVSLQSLGQSVDVSLQRNTSLLSLKGSWDDPETAASITNCIRDVFLENGLRTRQIEAGKKLAGVVGRLDNVKKELMKSENNLQEFTTTNKVIDLDKETQWYLEQLINMDLLYEQAQIEEKTINLQLENLSKIVANLKSRAEEESANSSTMENLGDLNIKVVRLRDAIHEDKTSRAAHAELKQKELEYEQAKELFKKRLIAAANVEKAKNAFEQQKALTIDTKQTKAWKKEVEDLNKRVIPTKGGDGPSGPLLKSMMLKSFELELESVSVKDKVIHLKKARDRVKEKLDHLPTLQREFVFLNREVSAQETEKKTLESQMAQIKSIFESKEYDFTVISTARVPLYPIKSNRKLIAIGIFGAIFSVFFIGLLAFELLDTRIRSEKDLQVKLKLKVLGTLPIIHPEQGSIFPGENESALIESFRIISRQIRSVVPQKGGKILIVSAENHEGRTMVATNLASCYGRTDERVLLIDAQVRKIDSEFSVKDLITKGSTEGNVKGLGEYLSFAASSAKEVISPTVLPGVSCIPRIGAAIIPDLLASHRMSEFIKELSVTYSIILLDSPPVIKYVDADILCSSADAIVFVVKSNQTRLSSLKKALERLEQTGTPIIGTILTNVDKVYL